MVVSGENASRAWPRRSERSLKKNEAPGQGPRVIERAGRPAGAARCADMTLISLINPLYALSGFVVGVLVGLTGVGGGSLMTPLLVLVFGLHPSTAVGTDLLYAAATKSVGTVVHGFTRTIDWRIVLRLASGSVPATAVTLFVLSHLGKSIDTQHGLLNSML